MGRVNGGVEWAKLLQDAVQEPGKVMEAYERFWPYSVGNQILAAVQCGQRGLELGPLNTFQGWKAVGRAVKKGEKALTLCMPVSTRTWETKQDPEGRLFQEEVVYTRFVFRNHWFVLAQTEGEEYRESLVPGWSEERALEKLGVEKVPFDLLDGNCQGFAKGRSVAVSPLAGLPHKTLFHELAHVVLGHTTEGELVDGEVVGREQKELEAEGTALICCAALALPGVEEARGYMQSWWSQGSIPEKCAQRIMRAADAILKAGAEG
jgi:antirestriction protein ArdC